MVFRAALLVTTCLSAAAMDDLTRARTKVPRNGYRNPVPHHMAKTLNKFLSRSHLKTKPCHKWTAAELQAFQAEIYPHHAAPHNDIYIEADDTRKMRFDSLAAHRAHWSKMNEHAATHKLVAEMQRDGHCMEAVMWWTHHVPEEKKKGDLAHIVVPTLPTQQWRQPIAEEGVAANVVYDQSYNPSSTCLACHGGGMAWQDPDTQPPPLPRQVNGKDRARRCEEWYGDEEGGSCGPCDGIAGAYYGDLPDEGIYPDCTVVANASDVPLSTRASTRWPKAFSVEMRGADRWPRASASSNATCNYTTDCLPYAPPEYEGYPFPPGVGYHWYAQIHGVLYLEHGQGQFGGGRLRHETVYQFPSGEAGAKRALQGLNGETNIHLTEIHVQTAAMAAATPPQPGVMLNLEHKNMTALNASGIDDSKLDWRRIPAPQGKETDLRGDSCVCVEDPAGLPYFEGAYDNATYKGRVSFEPPWQTTGQGGLPSGHVVTADHWVKWVFHLFVDIDTGLPVMFSSPYGGTATYGNWTLTPDALWPESVGGGWRLNPAKEVCYDVTGAEACKPWTI